MKKALKVMKEKMVSAMGKVQQLKQDEMGGVSPLVVTIGLALLLLGIIIAVSPSIQQGITNAINTVVSRMNSL